MTEHWKGNDLGQGARFLYLCPLGMSIYLVLTNQWEPQLLRYPLHVFLKQAKPVVKHCLHPTPKERDPESPQFFIEEHVVSFVCGRFQLLGKTFCE